MNHFYICFNISHIVKHGKGNVGLVGSGGFYKVFRNLQIGCKKNQHFFLNCELFILNVY